MPILVALIPDHALNQCQRAYLCSSHLRVNVFCTRCPNQGDTTLANDESVLSVRNLRDTTAAARWLPLPWQQDNHRRAVRVL